MFKNYIFLINFKNFFKSGFYLDFFLKKNVFNFFFKNINQIAIFFLERFIVDFFFRNFYHNMSNFFVKILNEKTIPLKWVIVLTLFFIFYIKILYILFFI